MERMVIHDRTGGELVITRQPPATKFTVTEKGKEPELVSATNLHTYIKAWMEERKDGK